jgi:MFS family permease
MTLTRTVDDLNISEALYFAFLALGCILLQPTSRKIRRRPVYILGTFLNLAGCLMGGFQKSVEVYYVVNILIGFGAAPVDSLVQISTTDLFFAHERGTRLSFFALALGTGSYMGPVAARYITEAQGWRFCFWYLVIFLALSLSFRFSRWKKASTDDPYTSLSHNTNSTEMVPRKTVWLLQRTRNLSSPNATDEIPSPPSRHSQYPGKYTGKGWHQSIPETPILRNDGG